ncbi:sensor histidine kinase [Rhizobium sp. C4]|uniref:sensor histidine kinase n=1 Tax=Rhizobium sp. C4 TaxID=1349800 RepID=UPI001E3347C4|nr:ATP-binding protein [Rhizobium sp. C4]MCD2173125.1 PAS domain S-box protein [Rhizobium sp. C4]
MVLSVGIAFVAVSVVAFFYDRRAVDLVINTAMERLASETRLLAQRVEFADGAVEREAAFAAESPLAAALIQDAGNARFQAAAALVFGRLLARRADYLQVRVVALDGGREVVRVIQTGIETRAVAPAELASVAGERFFKEAASEALVGAVYYSHVEIPAKSDGPALAGPAVWRVVYPVPDAAGKVIGFAIIDVDYVKMLSGVLRDAPPRRDILLFNSDGDRLERLADSETVRFFRHDQEGSSSFIDPRTIGPGQNEAAVRQDGAISYIVRRYFSGQQPYGFVGVALREPESRLLALAWEARRETLVIGAAILIGVLLVALLASRRFADYVVDVAARSGAVIDSALDAIISIDEEGRILSDNPAVERVFQYKPGELIGQGIDTLMGVGGQGAHEVYLGRYKKTGIRHVIGQVQEVTARRRDGSRFPAELSVSETIVNGQRSFTGNVRDISARKAAEAERERLIKALARSNRELDEFAFVASHDLKAPLRVIENASSWLEEDLADRLDAESRENLGLLRSRVRRMDRLLDDLLEYSRIGRKTNEQWRQVLDGAELRDEVMALVPQRDGFTVTFDPSFLAIAATRMPLQQILINLIGNALKHHDRETGEIHVKAQTREDTYLISVIDDGPGIPDEYREQIFKMFQTLRPRDRVEGSGMGLAIVRKHIDVLGMSLSVERAGERGSIFAFTYPRSVRDEA